MAVATSGIVYAAEVKTNENTYKNDEDNYTGDRLSYGVDVQGKYKNTDASVCIPAKTPLRGLGPIKDGKLYVHLLYTGIDCKDKEIINRYKEISIDTSGLIYKPDRYGLTYGALVVPYKYHFSGSKDFDGNSTVGPFLGYRFDRNSLGVGVKVVGFLGASAISVTHLVENTPKKETLAGFSYGIGILGEIKNEFQLGLVFGKDRVGDDSGYEDNGKWWGAVALGFSFAN